MGDDSLVWMTLVTPATTLLTNNERERRRDGERESERERVREREKVRDGNIRIKNLKKKVRAWRGRVGERFWA